MRLKKLSLYLLSIAFLQSCAHRGSNPIDPYEQFNRKVHAFNMTFDKWILKPPAVAYRSVVPAFMRKGINNAYNNLDLIPTVANDLLQAEGHWAIRDTWRFAVNSTLGLAGFIDVASSFNLPPHSNDLGLTLAKWGDKKSPYIVIPILGPSTIRDGYGWLFQFALYSPYVYIKDDAVIYSLIGLRAIDLRSQLLDSEGIINEALDQYSFIRDAYLQHRQYLISGVEQKTEASMISELDQDEEKASDDLGGDYVDE